MPKNNILIENRALKRKIKELKSFIKEIQSYVVENTWHEEFCSCADSEKECDCIVSEIKNFKL